MSIRLNPGPTWAQVLEASPDVLVGMWVCSGSTVVAEICAGSGVDWLLIDSEHSPNSPDSIQAQLQVVSAYPAVPLVRVPTNDAVLIKQYLDTGAMNLLVPMIDSVAEAQAAVRAMHYPPRGIRGVGSALSRASRWNRIPEYLTAAGDHVSLTVQIESVAAVERASEIAGVAGVDAVFIGPSDLAASLGLLGQQDHPEVKRVVKNVVRQVRAEGTAVGVNAFNPATAQEYLEAGVDFICTGADVALLARGSEGLASVERTARASGLGNSRSGHDQPEKE